MGPFDFSEHPHRRYNPLTGDWVLVSPHRSRRPWLGQEETAATGTRPDYDAGCFLCPGNQRAGGERNPDYTDTFVFENDFSAMLPDTPRGESDDSGLLIAKNETGICRVLCFSPRHDLTLAEMDVTAIRKVVDVWCEQYEELGALEAINHVLIFENKGEAMGCSNPHPHGQIWAQHTIPSEVSKELRNMKRYRAEHGATLLGNYRDLELENDERIVCRNEHFIALVPFWATWPFETMILARRHVTSLLEMTESERQALADILRCLTARYDNLFSCSFPYSAGMHQAPTDGQAYDECDWHMHFYPPLLRSATVRKFMVGYEMLADPQRDITPEAAAARLRELPDRHFRDSNA